MTTTLQPQVLVDGLAYVESPRWHDNRLWFPHWGTPEILAVDLEGNLEVVAEGPAQMGHSIGWLPDGTMFVTGEKVMRYEPDGSRRELVDLSRFTTHGWSESLVDGRGNLYLNSINFDFMSGEQPSGAPGLIVLVTPDLEARLVATDLAFPNGMAITPDNKTLIIGESFAGLLTAFDIEGDGTLANRRIWAKGVGADGICLDAEGGIWCSSEVGAKALVRVTEGGDTHERIELDRFCFATALGGPDRRTLFLMCADWEGTEGVESAIERRTGRVLVCDAPAPGVGWP